MNIFAPVESINEKILEEQIKMLFDSTTTLFLINLVVASSLAYVFWSVVSPVYLTFWLGAILVMLMIRTLFYVLYKKNYSANHLSRYKIFLVLGSAVAGIIWGAGGLIMMSAGQIEYQLFIVLSLMAMTGGSAFTLSVYLPAYFAFSPVTLIPVIALLFSMDGDNYTSLGMVTLVFLVTLTIFNFRMNRNFKDSLALRFENLTLIEQLREKTTEAERANLAKSKFLAAASHDLRQPLYALSLFATTLDELVTDAKPRKVVGQILVCVESLKSLFDALLDISQLDAGVVDVEKSDFLLQHMFEKLIVEFQPIAEEKGLTLLGPKNIHRVVSEPNLLEQIVRNYLSNAVRYTESGTISLECSASEDTVTISVRDTGAGIPKESLLEIFDEFHQLGNFERDRMKGLGLGLSIVQRTAKLLQHKIDVQSDIGRGSTFSIEVERSEKDTKNPMPFAQRDGEKIDFNKTLIVAIDDEVSVREGLKSLLEVWDCEVVTAEDGDSAVEMLRRYNKPPAGIISDYRLRNGYSGIDAIARIQQAYTEDIPAIIMTGDIESHQLVALNECGHQVFHKPVDTQTLRDFLEGIEATH